MCAPRRNSHADARLGVAMVRSLRANASKLAANAWELCAARITIGASRRMARASRAQVRALDPAGGATGANKYASALP
jgi:hypothetical protein